jgi:tRNA pseudouridine55 synthase
VVDVVRRALRVRRVGHAGTLDPFASGLLLVLVGRATRLSQFLIGLPKSYSGVVRLGSETDTDDPTGAVVRDEGAADAIADGTIAQAMAGLTGRLMQEPPTFSAKHVGGRRAHSLARHGKDVALDAQEVRVDRFELVQRDGDRVRFVAEVSSGTYIRALARDLGRALGCGAHLSELRRTGVGSFSVEEALPLSALEDGTPDLRAPIQAVAHLPRLELDAEHRSQAVHGQAIAATDSGARHVALVHEGRLVAVAEPSGDLLKPRVVLEG